MSIRSLYFIISGLSVIVVALAITLTILLVTGHGGGDSHERVSAMSEMQQRNGMRQGMQGMGGAIGGNLLPGGGGNAQGLQQLIQLLLLFLQRQGIAIPGQGFGGGQGGGMVPVPQPQPAPATPARPPAAPALPTP